MYYAALVKRQIRREWLNSQWPNLVHEARADDPRRIGSSGPAGFAKLQRASATPIAAFGAWMQNVRVPERFEE
jgi:hypothetical protein